MVHGTPVGSRTHAQGDQDLLRLLTAGSVDDGKSTLIGRLLYDTNAIFDDQLSALRRDSESRGALAGTVDLSLLTDGLKAEREQGITIDVAYRYFATSRRKFIIADCPGHEQYTRNMATGASNCDLAVILVDARRGVLTQTRRHSFIASLLGIRHVVVAINKMDLVGYSQEVFEDIERTYREFSSRLEISDIRFIPLSALAGDNVVTPSLNMPWYSGETLLHFLETAHIDSDRNLIDLRLPVQYVIRPHQDLRAFAGTIASGVLRRGDEVVVVPSGKRTSIRSILTPEGERHEAFAPQAVTVTLTDEVDVSRGDLLAHIGNVPRLEQTFEALVVWLAQDELTPGRQYWIKHTTNVVSGRISEVRYRLNVNTLHREPAETLALNEVGRCSLTVNRSLPVDAYRRNRTTGAFVIIDRLSNATVGAGMIVDRATSSKTLDDHWRDGQAVPQVPVAHVRVEEREERYGQAPATVLLTGLSGSGKTTLAYALERVLFDEGYSVCVLDGRGVRSTIGRDLGFSDAERSENLRRSMEVARLLNDAGLICICSFLAPSRAVREKARAVIGDERFIEVYLSAPAELCQARDPDTATTPREGVEPPTFATTYEIPRRPDLTLETDRLTVDACVATLIGHLRSRGLLRKGRTV